jgi:hypothetical protein
MALTFLLSNIGAVGCVIAAAVLAAKGIPGWGWFLFIGLMMTSYPREIHSKSD